MKFKVTTKPIDQIKAGALVILHGIGKYSGIPKQSEIADHLKSFTSAVENKETKAEWFCTLQDKKAPTRHLLLDSVTISANMPEREKLKTVAARAVTTCRQYSISDIVFVCANDDTAAFAADVYEGAALGDFSDQRFKSAPEKRPEVTLTFAINGAHEKETKAALAERAYVVDGVNLARELMNAPNNELTPEKLAQEARAICKTYGMKCEVLSEKQIEQQGFRLLEHVGKGSQFPPRLIVMKYEPQTKKIKQHIALLGKGMCFDSGGYCIKPSDSMHTMNGDMGGAAAVLGTMKAIGALKLPVRVTAIVPSAVNSVDGAAYLPGCIVKSKLGKTVYVENTDAEGRLILADAMARAQKEKPDIMIDYATLTGSAAIALGPQMAALFTDDEELRNALQNAGEQTGDHLWPLPLFEEYAQALKHPLADLNNISSAMGRYGGAITAALFLREFVPTGVRWAHIDMSMAARAKKTTRYFNIGGTGFGVRVTVQALKSLLD